MASMYYLNKGEGQRESFSVPAGWNICHFLESSEKSPETSLRNMFLQGVSMPVASPSLPDLSAGAKRVVLLVDDNNRPTPVREMLPPLLEILHDNGVRRESITIVVALGTHAAMNESQLDMKIGKDVVSAYRVIQHDARASDLVPLATFKSGRKVRINAAVAAADLKISLGSILPHPMCGFGGTPKMIMPGVTDFESIKEHHTRFVAHPRSTLGSLAANPFHEECMSVAAQVGVDFCINSVYDRESRVVEVVAGSLQGSYHKAAERCLSRLGVTFDQRLDITITSTVPHVHGTQMLKALSAAGAVTREGGAILFFAPLEDPLTPAFVEAFREIWAKSGNKPLDYILETLARGEHLLPGRPMDFNMAVFDTFSRAKKARVILVSPLVTKEEAAVFGFDYADSLDAAVKELARVYPEARVGVFPSGGLMVPIFANSDISEV